MASGKRALLPISHGAPRCCSATADLSRSISGVRSLLALLLFILVGTCLFFCWMIVTGCCIPATIKEKPESIQRFLRQLCIGGSILAVAAMGVALAVMTGWLTVHTRLALSYSRDGCKGNACPHLDMAFWGIFASVFLLFFSSIALGIQTKTVTSSMHQLLGEFLNVGDSLKVYAEKKARYDYAVHRMGKDWAKANLREPKMPEMEGREKVLDMSKKFTKNAGSAVAGQGLGFLENVTEFAGHHVDLDGSEETPAQGGWVDQIQAGGGFKPPGEDGTTGVGARVAAFNGGGGGMGSATPTHRIVV